MKNVMNNKIIVIVIILSALLVIISIPFIKKLNLTDTEKFYKEYTLVSSDNVFVYKTASEIIDIMEHGTGVVFLGFPECPWCQYYVRYLNEVAIEVGIDKIYYYNIKKDRDKNTDSYKKMVSILEDFLQYDDNGVKRIYVPNVSFHVNGELIGVDYETAYTTLGLEEPYMYWTDEAIENFKQKLYEPMYKVKYNMSVCTECNK